MELSDVQKAQTAYDDLYWQHESGPETICHSERHIGKLLGKLATIAEVYDHGHAPDLTVLDDEIIPDLLIFAARLANDRGISLDDAFATRTEALTARFASAKKNSDSE